MADEEHGEEHGEGGGSHGGHGAGGHGGGGHEEHEGAPEWLISFADNVALLMGFFVILLAMNMAPRTEGPMGGKGKGGGIDSSRMMDFVIAMREGFNNPIKKNSVTTEEQPFVRRIIEREGGEGARPTPPPGKHVESQSLERGTGKDVTVKVEFETDSADLSPMARTALRDASPKLKDQGYIIEVRGHASPFEARRDFDRASKLAYDRAMTVARALIENGVKKEGLSVVSRADNDRVVAKAFDAEAARSNQRVEIILTPEQIAPDPFATAAPAGSGAEK